MATKYSKVAGFESQVRKLPFLPLIFFSSWGQGYHHQW